MECYIFKAAHNRRGFIQKDGDDCFLYVYPSKYYSGECVNFSFSKHEMRVIEKFEIETDEDRLIKVFEYNGHQRRVLQPPIEQILPVKHPGSYYPRINKGNIEFDEIVFNSSIFIDEIRSFNNICDNANAVFNFIEPSQLNLNSYGHKSRELLITACTEAEYLLLRFLKDNKYDGPENDRFNTAHYFCANEILKLKDYSVRLKFFPTLGPFSPFKDWAEPKTTESLPWYDAYNKVKHDRGGNFSNANLGNVINAIAAIHILLAAQYGAQIFQPIFGLKFESIFHLDAAPNFELEDLLCPIFSSNHINYIYSWQEERYYFEDFPNEKIERKKIKK